MSAAPLAAGIAGLARLLDGTAITSLTLSEGGETITLRRDPASGAVRDAVPTAAIPAVPDGLAVTAPCPGIFLPTHPLREDPLAVPGQVVTAGAVLGLLRAGPLLLAVSAPRGGTVLAVEVTEGALVGYGCVLFRLAAEANEDP